MVKFIVIFFVWSNVLYCLINDNFGFVKIFIKFFIDKLLSLILIGKWFCNFGIKLFGLDIWKVLVFINSICLVFIVLYLVWIMLFLSIGKIFFWIFCFEIFWLLLWLFVVILLILFIKMIFICFVNLSVFWLVFFWLISLFV